MSSSGWDRRNPNRIFVSLPARPKWHCPMAIGKDGGCSGILLFLVAKIYMPVVSRRNFFLTKSTAFAPPILAVLPPSFHILPHFLCKASEQRPNYKTRFFAAQSWFFFFLAWISIKRCGRAAKFFFFSFWESSFYFLFVSAVQRDISYPCSWLAASLWRICPFPSCRIAQLFYHRFVCVPLSSLAFE